VPKEPELRNSFWLQMVTRENSSRADFPLMRTDEKFEFQDVSPGSYVIIGMLTAGGKELFIHQPIEVENADIENLNLELLPAIELSGAIRKEGNPSAKMPDGLRVMLDSDTGFERTPVAQVKPDGSFAFESVRPGAYELMMGPLGDMYIKTVRLGDNRSADTHIDLSKGAAPLEIVLASDVCDLEGTVQKANGDPAVRVEVSLIPEGAIKDRGGLTKFGFTDEKGKFHLRNIVPGEYRVFAWLDAPSEAVNDPDFRKPYEKQGATLKLDPNSHATVDLTAISTKESGPPSP